MPGLLGTSGLTKMVIAFYRPPLFIGSSIIGGSHVAWNGSTVGMSCLAPVDITSNLAGKWHVVLASKFVISRKQPHARLTMAIFVKEKGQCIS